MSPPPLLSHVTVSGPQPVTRWCFVLHGILGTKTNWRTHCRRLADALPGVGFALVDLRKHGESQDFAAPHTLDAVARDLDALADTFAEPVTAVLGHSYGGKSALAWAAHRAKHFAHVVVVDSNPGARADYRGSEGTIAVVDLLAAMPPWFGSREAFMQRVLDEGQPRSMAAWLAMNLTHHDGGFRLRVDVAAIREMLDDYFRTDLWRVVESPPEGTRIHFLVGGRSTVLDAADRARLDAVDPARCTVDVIETAGHYVHVDAPDAVHAIVTRILSG